MRQTSDNVTKYAYTALSIYIICLVYFYRPQRSCGQGNIFTPVCHSVHRGEEGVCLSACWDTPLPLGADPPGADPPGSRPPPGADTPLGVDTPREADSSIRSMSGRYASYWNAFLSILFLISSMLCILFFLRGKSSRILFTGNIEKMQC